MKCKIKCPVHSKTSREWEITPDGRVWPCCYFANGWDSRHDRGSLDNKLLMSDEKIRDLMENDSDWNSLEHHSLSDIIKHQVYQEHLYLSGWESDNPSPVCVEECGVFIDAVTGLETTNSNLYVDLRDQTDD